MLRSFQQLLQFFCKAGIEHGIDFINNDVADGTQKYMVVTDMLHQPPRCGHHQVQ
jgi:hypothetical protein